MQNGGWSGEAGRSPTNFKLLIKRLWDLHKHSLETFNTLSAFLRKYCPSLFGSTPANAVSAAWNLSQEKSFVFLLEKIKISTDKALTLKAGGLLWRAFCMNRWIGSNVPHKATKAEDIYIQEKPFLVWVCKREQRKEEMWKNKQRCQMLAGCFWSGAVV